MRRRGALVMVFVMLVTAMTMVFIHGLVFEEDRRVTKLTVHTAQSKREYPKYCTGSKQRVTTYKNIRLYVVRTVSFFFVRFFELFDFSSLVRKISYFLSILIVVTLQQQP
jgi:hypothetical protein